MKIALIELRLEHTDKYIFQRRDGQSPTSPYLLAFFGGGVKPGEQPDEAAIRELAEETSLEVGSLALTHTISSVLPSESHSATESIELHLFSATVPNPDFIVKEGNGCEIYTREELLSRDDLAPTLRHLYKSVHNI